MAENARPGSAEAQPDPVAVAAVRLRDENAILLVAQGELRTAKARGEPLKVAEAKTAVAEAKAAVAEAELGLAKAKLLVTEDELKQAWKSGDEAAVAEAKVAVEKAEVAVAEAKVAVAESKWASAGPNEKGTAKSILDRAIRGLEVTQDAYERALRAGSRKREREEEEQGAGSSRLQLSESRNLGLGKGMRDSVVETTDGKDGAHSFLSDGQLVPNYPFADHVEETLFVRPPMKDLWQFLDKHMEYGDSGTVIVQGAPGIGKTLAVWVWCLDYATREGSVENSYPSILFIRVKSPDVSYAVLSNQRLSSGAIVATGGFTCDHLRSVVGAVGRELDLVVVDGLDGKNIRVPLELMNPAKNPELLLAPKLVVSLSMQASLREESMFAPGSGHPYRQIRSFPGWEKEEYPAHWKENAKFPDWHYYAGSSIRLMWACVKQGEEAAKAMIDNAFRDVVGSDIQHLIRLTASPQNSTAVNRILVSDNELVSRYAFDKAWEQMHGDYKVWYDAFADRPQAIGWVYERQVLESLFLSTSPFAGQVAKLGLETAVRKNGLAHPITQTTVELKAVLEGWSSQRPPCGRTVWFIPRLGTFPNIDAAAIVAKGRPSDSESYRVAVAVFGIQVTAAPRHDLFWSAYASEKANKEGVVKLCSMSGLFVANVFHVSVSPHEKVEWNVKTKCDDIDHKASSDTHISWRPDEMGDRQGTA